MAGFYQAFTAARATEPDTATLLAQLKVLDGTAGVQHTPGTLAYILKKNTAWSGPAISAAQNILDTAPAASVQLSAQAEIDAMSTFQKAIELTILDQFNLVRAALPTPLPAITVAQMLSAIRTKAGQL